MANQQQQVAVTTINTADLLEEILSRPVSERARVIGAALDARIDTIEEMLPDFMKGQGARLAKRAQLTFAKNPDLAGCPPDVFIRCVLEAAEFGFAIDGKLAYVVKYKSAYQMQLDYKAIVAVAKRMKTIKDIYADVVYENDTFRAYRKDGQSFLMHERPLGEPRGTKAIGAYSVILLASGEWRYELMDIDELNKVQASAPSKSGPWATWTDEQRKKTVVRRTLKMYADDPGVIRLLEVTEDLEFDDEVAEPKTIASVAKKLIEPPPAKTTPRREEPDNPPAPSRQEVAESYARKPDESSQIDPLESLPETLAALKVDLGTCTDERGIQDVEETYLRRVPEDKYPEVTGPCDEKREQLKRKEKAAGKQKTMAGTT